MLLQQLTLCAAPVGLTPVQVSVGEPWHDLPIGPAQRPDPSQVPLPAQIVPAVRLLVPHVFALHVACSHELLGVGQSLAPRHCTSAPLTHHLLLSTVGVDTIPSLLQVLS
jgi:hypothetical protein